MSPYTIKMECIKLYPALLPSAPENDSIRDGSWVYILRKIEKIEQYLRREVKVRDGLAKKFKMYDTCVTPCYVVTIITSGRRIATLTTGLGTPLCVDLEGIALAAGLGQADLKNAFKLFSLKASCSA